MPSRVPGSEQLTVDGEALVGELEAVRQRGYSGVFDDRGSGPVRITELAKIVQCLYPALWRNESTRVKAIELTLRRAIDNLPKTRLPDTPDTSTVTWQGAALIMYQLEKLPNGEHLRAESEPRTPQWYAKLAKYVRDVSGYPDDPDKFKDITRKMRGMMSRHLKSVAESGDDSQNENVAESSPDGSIDDALSAQSNTDAAYHTQITNSTGVQVGKGNSQIFNFGPDATS